MKVKMKRIKVRGKFYYQDNIGNLISAEFVKEEPIKIRTPKDALPAVQAIRCEQQEHVMIVTLDGNNQVIKSHLVTKGLANQSQIHPREIFRNAILDGAVSILVAHNHPSGNMDPSESDLIATKRLVEASRIIGIPVLDHVIVSALAFTSIRERFPAYFG